jgi:hypothetical protein
METAVCTIPDRIDRPSSGRWDWIAAGVALLVFAGLSAYFAAASGGFLEADGCTHYLYARFALAEPHYFTNVRVCLLFPRRWRG